MDESKTLLPSEAPTQEGPKYQKQKVILSTVIVGLFLVGTLNNVSSNMTKSQSLTETEDYSLQIEFSNEYTATNGHPATDYHWVRDGFLVEPHRYTSLAITGVPDSLDQSKLSTSCVATHQQSGDKVFGINAGSVDCQIKFLKVGDYTVQASVISSETDEIMTTTVDVQSRYVRRDIRKLTEDDKQAYLNAARTLYDITTDEGQGIYGENYKCMIYFGTLHLVNAVPDKQHDRLHDGLGFLTQHLSLTNEYELSIQAVNPVIAMPYWDFTQDMGMIRDKAKANKRNVDYRDLWALDLWQDDFFGTSSTHLHTVTTGRWAYTKVPKITRDSEVANAFGFLRAPWNFQMSPYVTRYHEFCGDSAGEKGDTEGNAWPTCVNHNHAVFNVDSFAYFTGYLMDAGHGGIHSLIGGAGGDCNKWDSMLGLIGPDAIKDIKLKAAFISLYFWRADTAKMPSSEDCSDPTSASCTLQYDGCKRDKFTAAEIAAYTLVDTAILENASPFQKEQFVRKVYCESKTPSVGEHIEGNSAFDVSFWPIHTTLERLLQYKMIVKPFTNMDWDGSLFSSSWSSGCKWGDIFDTDCVGHYEDDVTVGVTYIYDEEEGDWVMKSLSNKAMVNTAYPTHTHKNSFVYENFGWSHCEKEGITFKKVPK
mmetsp:Transcript_8163/g.9736  ORF Transcript_8163/g.9736 Transcript_8163/m.9736 type:complete len:649 (+) Transcript_8163:73-2019(+)